MKVNMANDWGHERADDSRVISTFLLEFWWPGFVYVLFCLHVSLLSYLSPFQ